MAQICIHNRPVTPGLYWMDFNLPRAVTWAQAEQSFKGEVAYPAEQGIYIGAFRNRQGTPLLGTRFEAGLNSGTIPLDEIDFIAGAVYPFGNRQTNSVNKIGFYAVVKTYQPIPVGAVPPITDCFDLATSKLLYQKDSRGKMYRKASDVVTDPPVDPYTGQTVPVVATPRQDPYGDYGYGYDNGFDSSGWGDSGFLDPAGIDDADLDAGMYDVYALMPVRDQQHPYPVIGTRALAGLPAVLAGITAVLWGIGYVLEKIGILRRGPDRVQVTARESGVVPSPSSSARTPQTTWQGSLWERLIGKAEKAFTTGALVLAAIVAAPLIFDSVMEILQRSQERTYEEKER